MSLSRPEIVDDLKGGIAGGNRFNSLARETETTTSIVELPGTLLVVPDTMSEKKSRPGKSLAALYEKPGPCSVT